MWFRANKLSLNLKQVKYILFRPSQRRTNCDVIITIDDQSIDCVKDSRKRNGYLGSHSR